MKPGDKVKVHYTGTLEDGTVFDSSEGKDPLEFMIGHNQVIAGFENCVKEMRLDEEKTITIPPKDAYGEKIDNLVRELPKNKMPADMKIEVGARLFVSSPAGNHIPAVVSEIKENSMMVDFNHPLAGKKLAFKIKVVEVN